MGATKDRVARRGRSGQQPHLGADAGRGHVHVVGAGAGDVPTYVREKSGLYHLAGWGFASRYEWAQQILANDPKRTEQLVQTLRPARTDEFPAPAERPLFSALDCSRFEQTFSLRLPPWQEALQRCMEA